MKKRICVAFITLLLCFILCSCGVCKECDGTLEKPCEMCHGQGEIECSEKECDDGIIGTNCTNCGGREGVEVCGSCEGTGEKEDICDTCEGDGTIINPITWETFRCGKCDGTGWALKNCTLCDGYGLICNYCRTNSPSYPSSQYYPYYLYCAECNEGIIKCEHCMGEGEIPCSVCAASSYEEHLKKVEEYKYEEVYPPKYENAKELIEEGKYEEAEKILQKIKDYKEAEDLLKTVQQLIKTEQELTQYVGRWELVSGNSKFFHENENINIYELVLKKEEEYIYLEIHSITKITEEYVEYQKPREQIKLEGEELVCTENVTFSVLENGNLKFEKNNDFCELKKVD